MHIPKDIQEIADKKFPTERKHLAIKLPNGDIFTPDVTIDPINVFRKEAYIQGRIEERNK